MNVCDKENDNLALSEEMNIISITENVPTLQDKYKCLQDVKQFRFMCSKYLLLYSYFFSFNKAKSIENKQKDFQIEKLSSILENPADSYETFCDAQGLLKNQIKTKSNFYEEKAKRHSVKYGQTVTFL